MSIDFGTAKIGSISFTQSLDSDIAALMRYRDAVLCGASPTDAFETYMRETSYTAQQYAQSINAASIKVADFEVKAKQSYITTLSQSKSFSDTKTVINTFTKEGLEKAGLSAEQFTDSVSQGNAALGKYLVSVGQGNASIAGYVGSLIKAKVATIGMQAATMALNMALSMGISALISFGISIISDIIHKEENLIAKSEEAADAIQSISDKFKTTSETVDDIGKRFAELSQGVNRLTGANESLSNDEYAEFLDLSNQLAEIFPTLSRNYDENGNAIVNLSGDVDTICNSLNSLLETERQIANQEIVDNLPDLYSGIKTKSNNYTGEIEDYKNRRDELESFVNKLSDDNFEDSFNEIIEGNILSIKGEGKSLEELNNITDSYLRVLDELGIKYTYLSTDYDNINGIDTATAHYYEITDWGSYSKEKIKSGFREIAETFQDEITNLNSKIASLETQNKANWGGLLSSISAWLLTDDSYNTLSDDMQSVIQSMVNNVDFSGLNFSTWEDVETYISDNLITPIKNSSPEVQKAFTDLFSISTSENSFTEYSKQVNDLIKKIAQNTDFTEDDLFQLTGYGDIVAKYKTYISDIQKAVSDVTESQLNVLSPDEIAKAYDYVTKYGIKTWDDLESALKNKTFDVVVDFDTEKEGLDNFISAIEESVSATGMSSDAIANLQFRYQDLDNYDASALFEKTTGGIHLNTKALNELEKEYVNTQKTLLDNKLDGLVEQYNILTEQIEDCNDAQELSGLYTQRANILQQIEDTSNLASQYAGLTSEYNQWLQAQSATDERDGYENIGKGYDSIKDLIDQGWVSDSEVTEYLDLLLAADQRTKDNVADFDKLTKKIEGTNFSIMDFFQYDEDNNLVSDGLFNFLDTVRAKLGDEFVKVGEDGAYSFDFAGDKIEKVAEALGMSTESVQILEQAMLDAGFDVIFDSSFSDIDNLRKSAKDAVEVLKDLKAEGKISSDIGEFNFKATDIENIKTQISDAKELLKEFTNEDGTVNLDIEGATEAASILATLIYRKSDLENPTLMNIEVDTSDAASDIEYAIGLLQQFKDANANLEVQTAMGLDTTDAQNKVDSLLLEMSQNKTITTDLSIDTSSVDTAISSINTLTPEVMVSAGLDTSKISGYVPEDKTATVTYEKDSTAIDEYNPPDFTRTVTFHKYSYEVDRYNPSNITRTVTYNIKTSGSAGAQGTAYTKGKWGTDNSGIALGGELGQELVVRNGRFFTIGDDSAEFFQYQKGDIIFNAEQTRQILANGKITNGVKRGVSYAEGTAFDSGSGGSRRDNGGSTHSAGSSNSSSSSSNYSSSNSSSSNSSSTEEDEPQIFDWIEIAIDRIERAINKLKTTAESTYKALKTKLGATADEITKVNEELELQQKAYNRYIQQANSVGLSSDLETKVKNGTIDINEYDSDTQDLIQDYQEWYEKALDCDEAIQQLHEDLAALYEDNFNNIQTDFENQLSLLEHLTNTYETGIDALEAKGYLESTKYYSALQDVEKKTLAALNSELSRLTQAFSDAMASGEIEEYSEAWYSMQIEINGVKESIDEANLSLLEYAKTMREIEWGYFDYVEDRISQITSEADFLIDLMSNSDLYTDKGQLTDEGMATMGLHTQNYNVYMAQADQYAEEILALDKEIVNDPYNTDLIERREELLGLQQDSIKAAEDEKQAIVDMVREGIEIELSALKELIDAYEESLDSAKSLYDYQNKVADKSKEIASLQKQLAAYSGDNSEETRATVQKLQVDLSKAQEDLAETEYEQFITDQKKLLDELYDEYEEILNQRLDDVDALIGDMIDTVNANSDIINDTLKNIASDVGYTLTPQMQAIWDGSTGALDGTISKYGDKFTEQNTAIQSVLNSISANVATMVAASDTKANETESNTTSETKPSTTSTQTTTTTPSTTSTQTSTTPKLDDATKKKVAAAIWRGTLGWGSNPDRAKRLTEVFGSNNGIQALVNQGVGKNDGGKDVAEYSYTSMRKKFKGYKTGGLIDYTGLAQVDGTPGKPELMLNAEDTDNFLELRDVLRAMSTQALTVGGSYNFGSVPSLNGVSDISNILAAMRTSNGNMGTTFGDFEINIPIEKVEDYNDFVRQLQKDDQFEKMIASMTVGRLSGDSTLEKHRYRW